MSELRHYFNKIAEEFNGYYTGYRPTLFDEIAYRVFRGPGLRRRFTNTITIVGECQGAEILDVGCGPGIYTQYFAEKGANVKAIDISENMIRIAKNNLLEADITNVELITGDFLQITFHDIFDYVLAIGLFDYIAKGNRDRYLAKMKQMTTHKIIITFPKRYTFQTPIRMALFYIKRQPVFFYTKRMIKDMARRHDLEVHFHNSGPIWTVEFTHMY